MPPIAIIHLIIILESALRPSEIIVYLGNAGLDLITEERVPVALIAQELSREAERMLAMGPTMLSTTTLEEQDKLSDQMYATSDRLNELVEKLGETGVEPEAVAEIKNLVEVVSLHIIGLEGIFVNNLLLLERKEGLLLQLSTAHDQIDEFITVQAKIARAKVIELQQRLDESRADPALHRKFIEQMSDSIDIVALLDEARTEIIAVNGTLLRVTLTKVSATESLTSAGPTSGDFPVLRASLETSLNNLEVIANQLDPSANATLKSHIAKFNKFSFGGQSLFRIK